MKKIRVIVETKVPDDSTYKQRDLHHYVMTVLEQHYTPSLSTAPPGRLRARHYSHVQGYETRVLRKMVTKR